MRLAALRDLDLLGVVSDEGGQLRAEAAPRLQEVAAGWRERAHGAGRDGADPVLERGWEEIDFLVGGGLLREPVLPQDRIVGDRMVGALIHLGHHRHGHGGQQHEQKPGAQASSDHSAHPASLAAHRQASAAEGEV